MFATSGSPVCDSPAKIAFDLAEREDAELLLFHVLGVPSRGFSVEVTDVRTGEKEDWVKITKPGFAKSSANTYDNQLKLYGEKTRIMTTVGVPSTEILRLARKEGTDMIVMGANTRPEEGGGRYRAIMGNTMMTVAKRARCPVLIVNRPCNTCWNLFSSIVYCTDFSKAADHAFSFALKAAKDIGCPLHIFHAVNIASGELGGKPTQASIEAEIASAKKKIEEKYLSQVATSRWSKWTCAKVLPTSRFSSTPVRRKAISSSWPTTPRKWPLRMPRSVPPWKKLSCAPPALWPA